HEIDAGIEAYLAATEPEPRRRAAPLRGAMEALRRHIYLEEEIVFPRLPPGPLIMPLMVMRREHGELWRRVDALAADLADPATGTQGLATPCRELRSLLADHHAKEEPVIYPHLDADLDAEDGARVRELLRTGTLPAGWVCQQAWSSPPPRPDPRSSHAPRSRPHQVPPHLVPVPHDGPLRRTGLRPLRRAHREPLH